MLAGKSDLPRPFALLLDFVSAVVTFLFTSLQLKPDAESTQDLWLSER